MKKNILKNIIATCGSQEKLAAEIGLTQQAISRWVKSGKVPAEHVRKVSIVTGVYPHEIRPDIFDAPTEGRGE